MSTLVELSQFIQLIKTDTVDWKNVEEHVVLFDGSDLWVRMRKLVLL